MEHNYKFTGPLGFRNIEFTAKVAGCLHRAKKSLYTLEIADWNMVQAQLTLIRTQINLASDDVIAALVKRNPDILRFVNIDQKTHAPRGLLAYLPLNEAGIQAIADGSFDSLQPKPDWICKSGDEPLAVYLWLVHMPNLLGYSLGAIAKAFDVLAPNGCPIFSRAINPHSLRLSRAMGFMTAADFYPDCESELLVIFPLKNTMTPVTPQITTSIARNFEDMSKVFAIRSATYIAEQFCHYSEEFDGNDFCATHFLGAIDGDPAGCIRIRFFNSFAKIERLAVRTEYRKSRMAFILAREAVEHCKRKGYSKIYGHSRLDLVRFWKIFGFRVRADRNEFSFANIQYVELLMECDAAQDAINIDDDPMKIIRPEGRWDESGPLDMSKSETDIWRKNIFTKKIRTVNNENIHKY